jgi:hypothetical protein
MGAPTESRYFPGSGGPLEVKARLLLAFRLRIRSIFLQPAVLQFTTPKVCRQKSCKDGRAASAGRRKRIMAGERAEGQARRADILRDNKPQTHEQGGFPSPAGNAPVPPAPQRPHQNAEQPIRTQSASLSTVQEDAYAGAGPNNANGNGPLSRNSVCLCQPEPKIPRPRNGTC